MHRKLGIVSYDVTLQRRKALTRTELSRTGSCPAQRIDLLDHHVHEFVL